MDIDNTELTPEQLQEIGKDFDGTRENLSEILLTNFPDKWMTLIEAHDRSNDIKWVDSAYFSSAQAIEACDQLEKDKETDNTISYWRFETKIKFIHEGYINPECKEIKVEPMNPVDLAAVYKSLIKQIPSNA